MITTQLPLPPVLGGKFSVQQSQEFGENPLEFLKQGVDECGDLFMTMIGVKKTLVVSHPHIACVILNDDVNYGLSRANLIFSLLLGEGSVTSQGETWKLQNKLARPSFTLTQVAAFLEKIYPVYRQNFYNWQNEGRIDLFYKIKQSLAQSILLYFGYEAQPGDIELIIYAYEDFLEKILVKARNPFSKDIRQEQGREKVAEVRRQYDELIFKIIDNKTHPIVEKYLSDSRMDVGNLRDQLASLIMLGYGSVVACIDATLVLLDRYGDYRQRVIAEIDAHFDQPADIFKLRLLQNVVNESLRMVPPAWMVYRKTLSEVQLGRYVIPKDTDILLNFYGMNYNQKVWENPHTFYPERFEVMTAEQMKRQFMAFGSGKRYCLGANLAQQEIILFIATLLKNHRLIFTGKVPGRISANLSIVFERHEVTVVKR